MIALTELLGAIALLLFGLRQVRNGMMRAYGTELKIMSRRTEGRVGPAFVAGLIAAVLLQSSTATAMITAGFASQGVMSTATAFVTILGADVGTAIAAALASQKLTFMAPFLLACGYFGGQLAQQPRAVGVTKAIVGLGLVLLGLGLIGAVSARMGAQPDFVVVLNVSTQYPLLIAVLGATTAMAAHSSLAVVLLTAGFIAAGLITAEHGIYLMLGANAGGAALPVIANFRAVRDAKLPVVANLILRLAGIAVVFACAPIMALQLGHWMTDAYVPVAAHFALNLGIASVGVAAPGLWLGLAGRIVPRDTSIDTDLRPQFLDPQLQDTPIQALAQAKREAISMANIAQRMVTDALPMLRDTDPEVASTTAQKEDGLDTLFEAIKMYLAQTIQCPLTNAQSQKAQDILSFTASMEHIGDIVAGDLMDLARQKTARHIAFSTQGLAEIEALHALTCINFDLCVTAFLTYDPDLARQLYDSKARVRESEQSSITAHIDRLGAGVGDSLESSDIHLDVVHALRRINGHLTTTAYLVLRAAGEQPRTKWRPAKRPNPVVTEWPPGLP
ncbi:Na/Pi cotransporter family protein [uncultured Tateyamaria sp.]|uniref:Na/Pi cotransporter family protein n=1 Tax=uncultured Tateyamaria sp. TaxID=455651 RepID=UPI002607F3AE|nr:Na/Pi cotransporter family protein [uncultured Tateyamaria sp.]